ncbi:hypothetical protein MMC27_002054 [Xylographa pallens]|nr:hypothetical protein [Xylographa pallens]
MSTFARFIYKLYRARSTMLELRKQGLPMPPYNPILGHLIFCYKIASKLPSDAHPNYLPDMIRREMPDLGPVYYLDTWPFGPQMRVVASLSSLHQITQEYSLPKYHAMKSFLRPITEGLDIVTMEGQTWKTWRNIFNPGFSAGHLVTLTSAIVEETATFCDLLQGYLEAQKVFRMKDLTDFLVLDVIGRVVLNTRLESQKHSNILVDGLRMQIRWLTFGADVSPFKRFNPSRPIIHRYNAWRMNSYVSKELDSRMASFQPDNQSKSVIDLALSAYLSESSGKKFLGGMDSIFRQYAMSQIKLFLFSDHDTITVLNRVRNEHAKVFGSDDRTANLIVQSPALLNQIPYTLAVIKETLRLYPAVSSTRAGEPGFNVSDDHGRQFPTNGFLVWANPQIVQRDTAYWLRPDEFVPERWLVGPDDPLHPIKGAWRPFEYGPRNCIGQELAMIEMKVVMMLTSRHFNLEPAYNELDRDKRGAGLNTVYGERGYQIQRAQPSDDLPCRVK